MEAAINIDRIAQVYMTIRDTRAAKRQQWERDDAAMEADQDRLKSVMLNILNTTGATSIATAHGTVIRTEKIKPSAADWSAVYDWVMQNQERFELLEKRLKPTFVKQFMEENAGQAPPGVNVHREFEVSVRRPNASASNNERGPGHE